MQSEQIVLLFGGFDGERRRSTWSKSTWSTGSLDFGDVVVHCAASVAIICSCLWNLFGFRLILVFVVWSQKDTTVENTNYGTVLESSVPVPSTIPASTSNARLFGVQYQWRNNDINLPLRCHASDYVCSVWQDVLRTWSYSSDHIFNYNSKKSNMEGAQTEMGSRKKDVGEP